MIYLARKEQPRLLVAFQKLDLYRIAAGNDFIFRVGDDHAHRRQAARQVRLLSQYVNHRPAKDLRDGLRTFQPGCFSIFIFEAITNPVPHQIVQRQLSPV